MQYVIVLYGYIVIGLNVFINRALHKPSFVSPGGSDGKESACTAGDLGSIPELGKSLEKKRLPIPVFWPGEFRGLCSPQD